MAKSITIFEVIPKKDGVEGMFQNVEKALPHVVNAPGFISVESFTSLGREGKYCFLCVFESEEAAAKWRNEAEHRAVQKDGHDNLFEDYKIAVTSVVREYTIQDREHAPADSNDYFMKPSS